MNIVELHYQLSLELISVYQLYYLPPICPPWILYLELDTLIEIIEQPYWLSYQTTVIILISLLTNSSVLCEDGTGALQSFAWIPHVPVATRYV